MSKPLALVTGSAKRLGAAMALRLAREGFRLAIHCNTSISEAREVVALIRDSGGEAQLFAADLALGLDARDRAERLYPYPRRRHGQPSLRGHDERAL